MLNFGVVAGLAGGAYWLYTKYSQDAPTPTPTPPTPPPQDYTNLAIAYNLMSDDLDDTATDISAIEIRLGNMLTLINRIAINAALTQDAVTRIEADLADGVSCNMW